MDSSSSRSVTPVSNVLSGRNAPVTVYNVAVGTKSTAVSTSLPLANMESVLTSNKSTSSDVGSLERRMATVNPSVTGALIQWLAGMQQNKVPSPTPVSLRPVALLNPQPGVTETTERIEYATKKKVININVKVLNKGKLKDCPVYVLRNIDESKQLTRRELIKELQSQFGSIVPETCQLPIGYFKGSTKITIRTDADIADIWEYVRKGNQVTLWCQGDYPETSSESEDEPLPAKKKRKGTKKKLSALEEKSNRVEGLIHTLKQKHGDEYNMIQYRLWAEVVDVGTHRYSWWLYIDV